MLSKIALRQGNLLRSQVMLVRQTSSGKALKTINGCPVYPEADISIETRLKNWEEANKLFFSPQRDEKNFPLLKIPEDCPPTRLVFLPATWFDNFYTKTGVSGPYVLCFGLTAYLFSKEVIMIEHQFSHFLSYWMAFYFIYHKWGNKLREYADTTSKRVNDDMFRKPIRDMKKQSEETIKELEKVEWQEEGQKFMWQSKKENIDLQLETSYRQRLGEVYQGVKKRLDYMVEKESLKKRMEQEHMSKWIVDNVVRSITPQQEKDALSKCIADLKMLSTKQQAAV